MKRIIALALTVLIAGSAVADTHFFKRRQATPTVFSGLPARTQSTGKITNNGCDGATLTCKCAAMNSAVALGACNAGTTIAEDAATGMYEITMNAAGATADLNNEKCIIKAVCGAGIADIVVEVDSAEYNSYLDITSMTATQHAVKFAGNTSGAGLFSVGGTTGDGAQFRGGNGGYSANTAGLAAQSASGAGVYATTGASGVGAFSGLATSNSAALKLTANGNIGALLANNAGTGTAVTLSNVASTDAVTVTAGGAGKNAIGLTPGTGGAGIGCGTAVCLSSGSSVFSNRKE